MRTVSNNFAILASNKIPFVFPTPSLWLWSSAPANRGFPNPLVTEKELELTNCHNLYSDTTWDIFLVYPYREIFLKLHQDFCAALTECFYLCAMVEQQQQNKNQSRWQHRDILGLFR